MGGWGRLALTHPSLHQLDGYIARTFPEQASSLGTVLDPLADKLLVCLLFLALTSTGHMPREIYPPTTTPPSKHHTATPTFSMHAVLLTAVVLGRDTLLVLGAFYLRFTTLPPPVGPRL